MKATLTGRFLLVERTETDAPVVPEPYPRPKDSSPAVYNSWRKEYRLAFDTEAEAGKALGKVNKLNNFDLAAAWLDKQ